MFYPLSRKNGTGTTGLLTLWGAPRLGSLWPAWPLLPGGGAKQPAGAGVRKHLYLAKVGCVRRGRGALTGHLQNRQFCWLGQTPLEMETDYNLSRLQGFSSTDQIIKPNMHRIHDCITHMNDNITAACFCPHTWLFLQFGAGTPAPVLGGILSQTPEQSAWLHFKT